MGDIAHMPALLERAFALPRSAGRAAICRGHVKVDGVTIGADRLDMARDDLAGKTVAFKEKSVTVSEDGESFRHPRINSIRDGLDNRLF